MSPQRTGTADCHGRDGLAAQTALQVGTTPMEGNRPAPQIWALEVKPDSGPGAALNPAADH